MLPANATPAQLRRGVERSWALMLAAMAVLLLAAAACRPARVPAERPAPSKPFLTAAAPVSSLHAWSYE